MVAKTLIAAVALLAIALPLRSDPVKPPMPETVPPIEQMIGELKQIAELVRQLDDKNFVKRQQASEKLVAKGKRAVEPLNRILAAKPTLETATRIQAILEEIKKKGSSERLSAKKVRMALDRRITLDKGVPPNTTLKDVLDFFETEFGVPFLIDSNAFAATGVQKVEEQPVQLPIMAKVPLRKVLRLLLGQIKGEPYFGTFLAQDDHVLVTTTYYANPELWGKQYNGPNVDAEFDGKELTDALRDLSELTGISVVLDRRMAEKAQVKVTAAIRDVPLDTAVRMLADMAGLKVAALPNALYVTSGENAKALEEERKERRENGSSPSGPSPEAVGK